MLIPVQASNNPSNLGILWLYKTRCLWAGRTQVLFGLYIYAYCCASSMRYPSVEDNKYASVMLSFCFSSLAIYLCLGKGSINPWNSFALPGLITNRPSQYYYTNMLSSIQNSQRCSTVSERTLTSNKYYTHLLSHLITLIRLHLQASRFDSFWGSHVWSILETAIQ